MSKHTGAEQYFGLAKEAVRGSGESTAQYWYPFTDFSVQERVEKTSDAPTYGRIEKSGDIKSVRKYSQGDITAKLGVKGIPLVLLNLFGSMNSSDNGDLTYNHKLTVENGPRHQSLTMVRKDGVNQHSFPLGMLESFGLDVDIDADEHIYADMSFTGKSSISNSDTPSFNASDIHFTPNMASITTADSGGGLDAGTAIPARSFTLEMAPESLEREHTFESGKEPNDINNGGLSVEGSFTARFSDSTYEDLVFNDTEKALRIELKDTATTIGSESENPKVQFNLEKVFFKNAEKSGDRDGMVDVEVEFEGRYDLGASEMINAIVTNRESSY